MSDQPASRPVSVAAVFELRDACEGLLAHSKDGHTWTPRVDPMFGTNAEDAFREDALALALAVKRVIDQTPDPDETS